LERTSVILSHRKDADGICSAAILKLLKPSASVLLSDYSDMVETIGAVSSAGEFYIADLALNESSFTGFLKQMERLRQSGTKIEYIDHHNLKPEYRKLLEASGVEVYHSIEESAAVLVYKKYRESLEDFTQAKILAAYGAITDLMDHGQLARKLISSFDRQFLLYESTVLAFTISVIRKENHDASTKNNTLLGIVDRLAKGEFPHALPHAIEYSQEFAENASKMLEQLKQDGRKAGSFAYVKTSESSTGNVAYALIGALNVPVGMAYREDGPTNYEVSLRATDDFSGDLSKIVGTVAQRLGTSGGGHAKASGIRIKQTQLNDLIQQLQTELP
jgi:oligoribonuclease NrnB/cAMP/cGMP phosphodiesterase (DHH superfamily)